MPWYGCRIGQCAGGCPLFPVPFALRLRTFPFSFPPCARTPRTKRSSSSIQKGARGTRSRGGKFRKASMEGKYIDERWPWVWTSPIAKAVSFSVPWPSLHGRGSSGESDADEKSARQGQSTQTPLVYANEAHQAGRTGAVVVVWTPLPARSGRSSAYRLHASTALFLLTALQPDARVIDIHSGWVVSSSQLIGSVRFANYMRTRRSSEHHLGILLPDMVPHSSQY